MTDTAKSNKEATSSNALHICSDFLSDWDRFISIVDWMEDAVNSHVAKAGDGQMDAWVAEAFSRNVYWLRNKLEDRASDARKALGAAGHSTGPRA